MEIIIFESQYKKLIYEVSTPLDRLKKCKITSDGKYIVYEGRAFNTSNGEEVPINEQWTLSDVLHTGADVLSAGLDFVIPGSGAVVDVLNALSYIIEAQFKSDEEKDSLYLMAAITFAFVILPGPLQAIAVPLKRAVKTGVGMTSSVVVKGLKIIKGSLDTILTKIPSVVQQALKSPLAKNILGKYGGKISGFIDSFNTRIKSILGKLDGEKGIESLGKESAEKVTKKSIEVTGDVFQKNHTLGDVGIPDDWWDLPTNKMRDLIKKQNELLSSSVNSLIKKTSNLADKSFNPNNVKILSKSNIGTREIMEVQLENGQNVIFYKVTGKGGKSLPPPGAWSVIPGFLDNAYVQGKKVKNWFLKTEDTISLTHTSFDGRGSNKYLTEMSQFLQKNGVEELGKNTSSKVASSTIDNSIKSLPMIVGTVSKEMLPAIVAKSTELSKLNNVPLGGNGIVILNKLGFSQGKSYKFGKKTFKIPDTAGEYIDFEDVVDTKQVVGKIKIWDFLKTYIIIPSTKLNTDLVPLSTKIILRIFDTNGKLNTEELKSLPNGDPSQAQKDLNQLSQLVAEYEGNTGKYTVNNSAKVVQQSLMKLGYSLPRFGDDGKFGPETMSALVKFQQDNSLPNSIGKMDRYTARKIAEVLKNKNISGSEDLQKSLNSM